MTFFCLGNDVDEVYQSSTFCPCPTFLFFSSSLPFFPNIFSAHTVFIGLR